MLMSSYSSNTCRVVEEKWYNELECEYDFQHRFLRLKFGHSPMLVQLVQEYMIFDIFHHEFDLLLKVCRKVYLNFHLSM